MWAARPAPTRETYTTTAAFHRKAAVVFGISYSNTLRSKRFRYRRVAQTHGAIPFEFDGNFLDIDDSLSAKSNFEQKSFAYALHPILVENEVAKRVVDVLVLEYFMLLHNMRVAADDDLRSRIHKVVREPFHPL